jgi:hypothetical protein
MTPLTSIFIFDLAHDGLWMTGAQSGAARTNPVMFRTGDP